MKKKCFHDFNSKPRWCARVQAAFLRRAQYANPANPRLANANELGSGTSALGVVPEKLYEGLFKVYVDAIVPRTVSCVMPLAVLPRLGLAT